MAGHSKWNNIKRKKEKTDGAKAKIFTNALLKRLPAKLTVKNLKVLYMKVMVLAVLL